MIGIGIIGAGHFGAVHARALAGLGQARLVAACRNDAKAIAGFVREHGGAPYTDWRALLADRDVDAVVIATPHHLHEEIAIAALAAGKHVLLEKPMAPDIYACQAINSAAAHAKTLLMIGHVMHFFRPMMLARQIVESGEIGTPVAGHAMFSKLWVESNRQSWHLSPETGGGMLLTAGIHALDRLVFLMGGQVAAVSAMAATLFHDQQADDTAALNLRFDDGRLGQVTSIGHRGGGVRSTVDIVGSRGTLALDFDTGLRVGSGSQWRDIPDALVPDGMLDAIGSQWKAFIAAIRSGSPSPTSGAYGAHIVEIIAAALQSSQTGETITLETRADAH